VFLMPEVLDWQTVADPHAAVEHALRALRTGRLVAFPTETSYILATSALVSEAVAQLRTRAATPDGEPLSLAVRGVAQARDWVPGMSRLGQRLARRLWPGPLTLAFSRGIQDGLLSRLPDSVPPHILSAGTLHLRTPAHELILEVLRHLPAPLVCAPVRNGSNGSSAIAVTAQQVLEVLDEDVALVFDGGPSHFQQAPTVVAVDGGSWSIVQPGVLEADTLRQRSVCVIVFVCTGNTCRSPLAESLFKKRLADQLGCAVSELPARGFCILSAGLASGMGGPAAAEAIEVARSYGADLTGHQSRPLSADLVSQADFLIAMTHGHVGSLRKHFPNLGAQPRLLAPNADVADPIGLGQEVYAECGRQIWQNLEALVAEVQS
jgi:protein-tyrosine phosphatase